MLVGIVHRAPCGTSLENLPLLRGLAVSLLLQAMILFSNEASDAASDDASTRTMISGGAGVGAEGALSPHALRRAGFSAGAIGLVICAAIGGLPLASIWLLAALLVWAYDGHCLRLSRHPLGCLCQAAGVGVVTPLLGGWCAAIPLWPTTHDVLVGLCLGMSGHILTALPDHTSDGKVGKNTIVVTLGTRASFALMLAGIGASALLLLGVPAVAPCANFPLGLWPRALGLIVLAGLLAWAWRLRQREPDSRQQLTPDLWLAGVTSIALWIVWIVS